MFSSDGTGDERHNSVTRARLRTLPILGRAMTQQDYFRTPWTKPISLIAITAIVAIAAYFIITDLAEMNKELDIGLDKEGKVTIRVSADDRLSEVLKKAIAEDSSTVEAVLASKQYYKLTNPELVDKLRSLDASEPDGQAVSERMRELLWNLEGPFSTPGTLRGADTRMIMALDDLDTELEESQVASVLLTELWRLSLERKGVFKPRPLQAGIQIVPGLPSASAEPYPALVCPGSVLVERELGILGSGGLIKIEAFHQASLFDCDPPALTAGQMLEGGIIRIGLSELAFRKLVGSNGAASIGDGKTTAIFEIYPRNMTAPTM